jgi:hypothetical protein
MLLCFLLAVAHEKKEREPTGKRRQMMNNGDELLKSARNYIKFCLTMSCGHCVPCRLGLPKLFRLLTAISGDRHKGTELEQLENLVRTMEQTSLCPVGQTSPLPIKTLLAILKDDEKETGDIEKSLELVKCRFCGRPFAFKAFLEYFQASVDKSLEVHLDRDYCPECVRKARAIDIVGKIVKQ